MTKHNDQELLEVANELEELAAIIRYGVEETSDANAHIKMADPTGNRQRIVAAAGVEVKRWIKLEVQRSR